MKKKSIKYLISRRIAALKKMSVMVLARVLNFRLKDTPVLMASNADQFSLKNKGKALAMAAAMPIVAVPIQEVHLLDYALAHETVNEQNNLIITITE